MHKSKTLPGIRGVVFDMDGTLTVSNLDFDAIRNECGVDHGIPLLEFLESAPEEQRRRVQAVLERHEKRAALECELRDGAREVVREFARRGLKTALLTRNSAESVRTVMARFGLEFDCWISREQARPKPAPDAVLEIARRLGLSPAELVVVGDYVFDVHAGRDAGSATVFVTTKNSIAPPEEADFVVDNLRGLLRLMPESA